MKSMILTDGRKTVSPWDLSSDAGWNIISGPGADEKTTERVLYHRVPWLKRAVDMIGDGCASVPFVILNSKGQEVDNSDDYQNKVGFWANPREILSKMGISMTMLNQAYLWKDFNPFGYPKVKYIRPDSIEILWDGEDETETGIKGFRRKLRPGKALEAPIDWTAKDPHKTCRVVYVWRSDIWTEAGPTVEASPAQAAMNAAGVIYQKDRFVRGYFEHGAIKVTILSADTNNENEAARLKEWWRDVIGGVKNAWSAFVLKAKQVVPTVIGGGLEELKDHGLTEEARRDIAAALGIPYSKLFSGSAAGLGGGGVRDADDLQFFTEVIIPLCYVLQDALNEQLFKPEGYQLKFTPKTMELFQTGEAERTASLKTFGKEILPAFPTFDLFREACLQYGVILTDGLLAAARAYYDQKGERAEAMVQNFAKPAEAEPEPESEPGADETGKALKADIDRWRRKAFRLWRAGRKGEAGTFDQSIIPPAVHAQIAERISIAKTEADLEAAFVVEGGQEEAPIDITAELKRANDLLERMMEG